uniref:1-aminocyclopropane-1-carboxylate synthase-like protein 1 n=1 Tax=Erpetoichthys calabaricus TaxID=27687 RepID=A0A8C4RFV8_ERPCA
MPRRSFKVQYMIRGYRDKTVQFEDYTRVYRNGFKRPEKRSRGISISTFTERADHLSELSGFSDRNVACSSGAGPAGGTGAPLGSSLGTIPRLRKRRKAGRPRESLDEALVRFLSSQRAAEERFLALEECRLQREAEAEERRAQLDQRRAEMERQHEFRMFSVFAHMVSALRPDSSSVSSPHFGRARREEEDIGGHSWAGADTQKPSPYLSRRGNLLRDYEDILQEGFVMYSKDKHDEDKNPTGIINLGTSENKLCFDLLSKRLTQSDMFQIDPPLLQYGDWKGHSFLREEVARFLSYYCKAPSPLKVENVVVLNGCTSTFSAVAAVICDPEDAILIPTPSYGAIARDVFLYSNVRTVHVHLESEMSATDERPFQLTVEKMEKALEEATLEGIHIKAVVFINPHNPLGEIYTPAEMMQFLEFAKRHKLHAFVDEIYMLSVFDEDATFHSVLSSNKLPDPQRTHVMWGMTKDFAVCGMRVACLYTENQDVIGALEPLAVFHGIPGTTQHQAAQLLHDRDWINQVYLPTNRGRLKAAHQYVVNELKALDIPFLDRPAGFFIWTDFRKFLKEETAEEEIALWRHFLNNKILLSCGKAFDCCQPGWFRIVFADKTYRLQLGMQRLRKALEELRKNDLTKDLKRNNQTEDPKRSRQTDGRLKSCTSEDRSWLSPSEDTKHSVLPTFDHILGSGADDIMQVSCQSQPASSGLDNLIEILKQQMRSSDWLQKNTPELFAQENPEVFDVYVKLREKPKDEDLEAKDYGFQCLQLE